MSDYVAAVLQREVADLEWRERALRVLAARWERTYPAGYPEAVAAADKFRLSRIAVLNAMRSLPNPQRQEAGE